MILDMKHGIKHNDIIEKVSCSIFRIMVQENLTGNIIDESNKTLLLNDPDELDECVFMNSSMFKKIFGRTWKSMSQNERLLPIVKISYKNDCIHRRYRQCSAKGLNDYMIGLTQRSISLLNPNEKLIESDSIELSIGNEKEFFETHPNHATRMSYKMSLEGNKLGKFSKSIGIWSTIIGIASLIISIISIIIATCYTPYQ